MRPENFEELESGAPPGSLAKPEADDGKEIKQEEDVGPLQKGFVKFSTVPISPPLSSTTPPKIPSCFRFSENPGTEKGPSWVSTASHYYCDSST